MVTTCPANSTTGMCDLMTESGVGIGNFLSALITGGLLSFIIAIAVIGGVVLIVYGIAHVVKNSFSTVKHR